MKPATPGKEAEKAKPPPAKVSPVRITTKGNDGQRIRDQGYQRVTMVKVSLVQLTREGTGRYYASTGSVVGGMPSSGVR